MSGRRRSAADLPRAPLELAHPLAVQGPAVPAAEILAEAPAGLGAPLLELLRTVLTWSCERAAVAREVDADALRTLEAELLARDLADGVSAPLAVLARTMQQPEEVDAEEVAWACLCVSDWAVGQGATETALGFGRAAAFAFPSHARYAWLVGRLLRNQGRTGEAESWLKRAYRVAVWTDDWEAQARSLNSLGISQFYRGRYASAKRLHLRTLKIARRHALSDLQAMATHDLFTIHAESGDRASAEEYAARAFELYGSQHPRLPDLVADVAHFWNHGGYYWRTLPLFEVLLPHFHLPEDRARILAGAMRAAGGLLDREKFEEGWRQVSQIVARAKPTPVIAAALLAVGIGAACLRDWHWARAAIQSALDAAVASGASDTATQAEAALLKVQLEEAIEPRTPRRRSTDADYQGDLLADEFLRSLVAAPT